MYNFDQFTLKKKRGLLFCMASLAWCYRWHIALTGILGKRAGHQSVVIRARVLSSVMFTFPPALRVLSLSLALSLQATHVQRRR